MKAREVGVAAIAAAVVLGPVGVINAAVKVAGPPALADESERTSYALGVLLARNAQRVPGGLQADLIERGLHEGLGGGTLAMSEQELAKLLTALRAAAGRHQSKAAQQNLEAGKMFLEQNARKEGVTQLPSGLQYSVLKPGAGPTPTDADTVVVNFRGTLIDGTEFDSSQRAGKPSSFPVSRLIKGWREALKRMPVGSRWQVAVPAGLAYGKRGLADKVGPNATVLYDIELLSIARKESKVLPVKGGAEKAVKP